MTKPYRYLITLFLSLFLVAPVMAHTQIRDFNDTRAESLIHEERMTASQLLSMYYGRNRRFSVGYLAQAKLLTPDQAAQKAVEQFGGKVLSVVSVENTDSKSYKVKLLSDQGRVHSVFVNKMTGQVFKKK